MVSTGKIEFAQCGLFMIWTSRAFQMSTWSTKEETTLYLHSLVPTSPFPLTLKPVAIFHQRRERDTGLEEMELYNLHQLEIWWKGRALPRSLPSFLLPALSTLTNFPALTSWPFCSCVRPAGPSREALGERLNHTGRKGNRKHCRKRGWRCKATWGHGERLQGDDYSKGGAGEQKLLQVLLVLVTAKSSSLACERECEGARQQELINKQ